MAKYKPGDRVTWQDTHGVQTGTIREVMELTGPYQHYRIECDTHAKHFTAPEHKLISVYPDWDRP